MSAAGRRCLVCALLLLSAGCALAPPRPIVLDNGPRGVPASIELAEVVKGEFVLNCTFEGGGLKAFVIYHLAEDQWKPMKTCNNGAGNHAPRQFVHANDSDPRRIITGWYTADSIWKQCDIRGWTIEGNVKYLSCRTPDGYSSTLTCPINQCTEP
jgi:hypothetical protein